MDEFVGVVVVDERAGRKLEDGVVPVRPVHGAALALLAATMFTRSVNYPAVSEDEKEPYTATQATSLALSELDPRGEDNNEQFDLFLAWMASAEADE